MQGPPENQVNELLLRWQQRHQVGETLSVDELCRDCPELAEAVRQRLGYFVSIQQGSSSDTATVKAVTLPKTDADERESLSVEGYTILGRLGHGGMGIVWKAKQLTTDRLVALKMLPASTVSDEHDAQRFVTEIQSLGSLNHPNIVQIHDAGKAQGRLWYAMEYVAGGSLAQKLEGDRYAIREAAQLVEILARTIHAAHQLGIIHRDLKPGNILLREGGTPKIADFGLARRLEGDPTQTPTGAVLGTPCYMSPEQASGKGGTDPRSDVYSLGAILFELLTGRPPFKRQTPVDTMFDVIGKEPPSLRGFCRELPRDLEAVCLKCLEKKPEQRYESALALAEDLARWQRGEATSARPRTLIQQLGRGLLRWRVATLLTVLALVLTLGFWAFGENQPRKQYERRLKRGQPVTLIGETGQPALLDWPWGEAGLPRGPKQARGFTLQSYDVAAASLLPSVPVEHFCLSAEVRHDQGGLGSEVGIFLGLSALTLDNQQVHLFCSWTFNDQVQITEEGNHARMDIRLHYDRHNPDGTEGSVLRRGAASGPPYQPAVLQPKQEKWRKIALLCGAEGITPSFEGIAGPTLSWQQLQQRVQGLASRLPSPHLQAIAIDSQGALGLHIDQGIATFKNVIVEPR